MSATKIGKGEYAYRGYELAVDATGWRIKKADMNHYPWDAESKKAAMVFIDELIDDAINQDRSTMTDAELIAIDGGWSWLEQRNHIHEEVTK
jgi:hypothetical protein